MVLMNLFAGKKREADAENRLVDTVGEGEGGKNCTETHTLLHVKQILVGSCCLTEGGHHSAL